MKALTTPEKARMAFPEWMEKHGNRLCADYDIDAYAAEDMLESAFCTGYVAADDTKFGQADAWALWLNSWKSDIEDAFSDYSAGYDLMKLTLTDGYGWEDK